MAPRVGRGPTHLVHRGRLSLDPTSSGADAGLSDGSKRVQAPSTLLSKTRRRSCKTGLRNAATLRVKRCPVRRISPNFSVYRA